MKFIELKTPRNEGLVLLECTGLTVSLQNDVNNNLIHVWVSNKHLCLDYAYEEFSDAEDKYYEIKNIIGDVI